MKAKSIFIVFSFSMLARLAFAFEGEAVSVPANLSHQAWDTLLKKYVNDRGPPIGKGIRWISSRWMTI